MSNTVIRSKGAEDTLKVTALLYFKEALAKEQYEDCAELIQTAKRFGAGEAEISTAIVEYLRPLRPAKPNEANKKNGGRRF